MPTIPHVEYDLEKLNEFRLLATRSSSNAVRLRIVERFLCEVDRWLLKPSPAIFDVTRIKESINTLRSATMDDPAAVLFEAEFQLRREFQLWQQLIEDKDQSIETYNFRRFCDSASEPLDNEIFVALATFYREGAYSHTNQSKFDLVVTRLFTDIDAAGRRHLRFSPKQIAKRAEQLLGETSSNEDNPECFLDDAGAVTAIHSFIAEAHGLSDFESLIQCRLFDRYRDFKRELGVQFFQPSIIAAAIQCNVVFANAFNEMLEAANDNLSDILTSDIDIPAALHDPSPQAQARLSDVLQEFFDFAPSTEPLPEGGETEHIWNLLSLVREKTTSSNYLYSDLLVESPEIESDGVHSARERLAPVLETLTKAEPDTALLLSQLNHTRSLRDLNVGDFLYSEDHSADARCRRILGLILWSAEFVQNELMQRKSLTPTAQHEALSLIQKSEEFATVLRSEIYAADESAKARLLAVLNALLESRLRLEGAIVQFTNKNLSKGQSVRPTEERHAPVTTKPVVEKKVPVRKSGSRRWLLWLLVFVALFAGIFYLYSIGETDLGTHTRFEQLDVNSLPNHELIRSAYRREDTLFVTVPESWTMQGSDKQKAFLKGLLDQPGATPYESVVVRDPAGHLLGNISANGVYVPEKAQTDSDK